MADTVRQGAPASGLRRPAGRVLTALVLVCSLIACGRSETGAAPEYVWWLLAYLVFSPGQPNGKCPASMPTALFFEMGAGGGSVVVTVPAAAL